MDAATSALAAAIGTRVRLERSRRNWTQDQLAEAAGVSRRMVVSAEQGAVNPSVGTLLRISDALGIGLPALVEPPQPHTYKLTRNGAGAVLWRGTAGGEGILVGGTAPPDVLELWDWTLGPGDRYETAAHVTGTAEVLQVQHGTVLVELGDETLTLTVGDALTFDGAVPHAYINRTSEAAKFSLSVFEPGVGTWPRVASDS
ncbi:XRE family transcriptional regulator [Agromyces sp. SYSU K20354]|uniref:helix-turn-helix domain-containing protein n=1 Tax=Agromyces cavernae TaxID=2898659 RepID=UPI001E65ADF1|nr:XRE family transcriptional regulator [Agromyces cavernae]MCD2442135.1 XRE family transcriptional regulator [Agromyces cavernae]